MFLVITGEFGSGMMPSPSDRSGVFISLAAAFRPPRPDGEPAMILGRRDALDASRKLITSVGLGAKEDAALASSTARNLFDAYLDALTDYTIDKPGDVGAWVRQAALDAIVVGFMLFSRTIDMNISFFFPPLAVFFSPFCKRVVHFRQELNAGKWLCGIRINTTSH